jgi:hypothetical protein
MKKLLCAAIAVTCLDVNGMIVLYNQEDLSIKRPSESSTSIRLEKQSVEQLDNSEESIYLSTKVNLRKVWDAVRLGKAVRVSIRDFIVNEDGSKVPVGPRYTKKYPLQITTLEYQHNLDAGFSNPVQELFAMVTDIEYANISGKMVVDDAYLDKGTILMHARVDCGNFSLVRLNLLDSSSMMISAESTAIVSYGYNFEQTTAKFGKQTTTVSGEGFIPPRKETVENWKRPEEKIFTTATKGCTKVPKSTLPLPIKAPSEFVLFSCFPNLTAFLKKEHDLWTKCEQSLMVLPPPNSLFFGLLE